jgi:Holliday junction resolvase RusA-like endonuclease
MPELVVTVQGMTPIPWGSNEWDWRRAIAEQARITRRHYSAPLALSDTRLSVTIVFFMIESRIQRADLDNLAKPVLDTLFRSRYPQVKDMSLTGALLDTDDNRVFKLCLEKLTVQTASDEGIQATISWD